MAVDDTWYHAKKVNDQRVKSAKYGRGKRYRVRYVDDGGRPRERLFDRKADAETYDANVRADVSRGEYVDPTAGRLTFQQYAERWRGNQLHADTTKSAVETHLRRHVYPRIGGHQLRGVRPSDIQGLMRLWSDSLAPATVAVIYAYVRAIFTAAVADRLISVSPCIQKRPKVEPARVKPMPLASVDALRDATGERWRALEDLGAAAGLRQGEAFGLEVEHVDFLRRTARVEQQMKTIPGQPPFLARPKTAKSRRTIPIGRILVDRLAAHLAEFPAVEVEIVDKTGTKEITRKARLISTTADGTALSRSYYNKAIWAPAIAAVEIEGMEPTYHDLRHFYASVLIAHGASVTQVQARLGHASAMETLRIYSHLWPDEDDRTRDILDAVLGGGVVPLRAVG